MINFDPEKHKYTDDEGNEFLSVTQLLSRMFPFEKEKIAEKVISNPNSVYYLMKKEDVLKQWADSALLGTEVHEAVEAWINKKTIPDSAKIKPLIEQFAKLPFTGTLSSEILVWDQNYWLAGTVDIIEEKEDHCLIWDVKTSKAIAGDVLMKYSMQLEIYRRLVETRYNQPARIGGIIWFADYVRQGEKTQLRIVHHSHCAALADQLLAERKLELSNQSI